MSYLVQYSQAWWTWASSATWQLALLVVLVAAMVLAGRRLPARFRYVLWSLILVKALLPPTLSSPFSVGTWGVQPATEWISARTPRIRTERAPIPVAASSSTPATAASSTTVPAGPFSSPATVAATGQAASAPAPSTPAVQASAPLSPAASAHIKWVDALLLGWLAGASLFLVFVAVRYLRLLRTVHRAEEIDEGPLRVQLEQLALRLGREAAPDLLVSPHVTSPFLMGLVRPRIILPADLPLTLSLQEMENVLLHELVHWKRRDVLIGWLQVLVQALFWFHPFVWFANARLRHERESACDAAVLEVGGDSPKGYGEALLKVLLAARGRSSAVMGFLGIFERDTRLQNRLEAIMNPQARNRRVGILGWLLVAAFAVVFMPMASAVSELGADDTPPRQWVRVVLAPAGAMTFEGNESKLDDLPALLEKVPDRADTVLQFSVTTDDMKLSEVKPVKAKLGDLVKKLGFKYLSEIENHPLGSWAISEGPHKNLLLKKITVNADKSPDSDRLSVQYAVIAVCEAAGIPYDWNTSTELADAQRRQFVDPVRVKDITAEEALLGIVKQAGVRFDVGDKGLFLYAPDKRPRAQQIVVGGIPSKSKHSDLREEKLVRILVSELQDRKEANALAEALTKDHYYGAEVESEDGKHRVYVGVFPSRAGADRLAEQLRKDGYSLAKVVEQRGHQPAAPPGGPMGPDAALESPRFEVRVAKDLAQDAARQLVRSLQADGYAPVRLDGENGKYCVSVGPLPSEAEASQLKEDLERNAGYKPDAVVASGKRVGAPAPSREPMTIRTGPDGEMTYSYDERGNVSSIRAKKDVMLQEGNKTITGDEVEIRPGSGMRVTVKGKNAAVRDEGPPRVVTTGDRIDIRSEAPPALDDEIAFLSKLSEDQRLYVEWTNRQFRKFIDNRTFPNLSPKERQQFEMKLIDTLKGPQGDDYYLAINTLAALRSKAAVPGLLEIAADRKEEDCRDRWMAIRALGIIGDQSVIPELVHLVYYPNQNTHFWAQISLVRLTGENFGRDWQAWGNWWNARTGHPPFKPEKIAWVQNPEWLDQAKQAEADRKFIDELKNRGKAPGTATPTTSGSSSMAYGAKGPDWSARQAIGEPDTENAGDLPSAWASLQPDAGKEWLELDYDPPLVPEMVRIHETFNPGVVTSIILKDSDGKELATVPVDDTTTVAPAFLEVPTAAAAPARPVKTVRVVLDSSKVPGWNEIDAVELIGGGKRGWAVDARASSSYADRQPRQRSLQPRVPTDSPQAIAGTPVPQEPPPAGTTILSYVGSKEQGKRSIGASGHAAAFRPSFKAKWIEAVQIFAGRYGTPEPPPDNFHLYVLNKDKQVLADLKYPYAMIERSDLKWYSLRTPSIEVPDEFFVALAFNPHQTKGIYLGFDKPGGESHSLVGLPDSGYEPVKDGEEWMMRVHVAEAPTGAKGTMRLADWKTPVKEEPFKDCVEVKYDTGKSEGMQSYGGRGPAIKFKPSELLPKEIVEKYASAPYELRGIRVYGSRYGSGFDPEQAMIHISVLNPQNKVLEKSDLPYSKFSYKEQWVDLALARPVKVEKPDDELTVAVDPEAHQTKGVYFHYNKNPQTSHSYAGTVEKGFEPVTDREWMIRAYFAPAGTAAASAPVRYTFTTSGGTSETVSQSAAAISKAAM